jgi:hypothetical protein
MRSIEVEVTRREVVVGMSILPAMAPHLHSSLPQQGAYRLLTLGRQLICHQHLWTASLQNEFISKTLPSVF